MKDIYANAEEAAGFIESHFGKEYSFCIVTGSGLDVLIDDFQILKRLSFRDIPHLKASTFHRGELLLCRYNEKSFLVLNGRLHYYEGYSAKDITFPVRILSILNIKHLLLTNASGGLNPDYSSGDLVLITDHINLMPEHPLRGINEDKFGDRFPDMSNAYNYDFRNIILNIAKNENINLKAGVYVGFQGPSLETPAEYRFLHTIGGDMVGMSTVPEAIVANHCGIKTAAISIVTNICYPPEKIKPTSLEDVINVANSATPKLSQLVNKLIFEL